MKAVKQGESALGLELLFAPCRHHPVVAMSSAIQNVGLAALPYTNWYRCINNQSCT